MAEEKQFDATPARLQRAKREGDLPRSGDLTAVVSFACGSLASLASLGTFAAAAREALSAAARPGAHSGLPYAALAGCTLSVIFASLAGALLSTYFQAGTFACNMPTPKFEKLNPFEGLKRLASRDSALAGSKALLVAFAVGGALVAPVRATFASSAGASPSRLAAVAVSGFEGILAGAVIVAGLFGASDVLLERAKWKRRLRMSFDEVKRDHKQSEGDPLQRGRRRQSHRALVRGGIARVKDAAFVVTNPTHVAIALQYAPPAVCVPRVLVRAVDAGAQEVKRLARALRIPVVEDVALARALLATTEADAYIPVESYAAVAAIVAALLSERATS